MRILYCALLTGFSLLLLWGCNDKKEGESGEPELTYREELRLKQYIFQGRKLYQQHCANCHQEDGSGLGRLIPPLENSDYMMESIERSVCIIKNGLTGEIMVNGKQYNQPMPANKGLTNIEVAEIVTYIHNTWGKHRGTVEVKTVERIDCNP